MAGEVGVAALVVEEDAPPTSDAHFKVVTEIPAGFSEHMVLKEDETRFANADSGDEPGNGKKRTKISSEHMIRLYAPSGNYIEEHTLPAALLTYQRSQSAETQFKIFPASDKDLHCFQVTVLPGFQACKIERGRDKDNLVAVEVPIPREIVGEGDEDIEMWQGRSIPKSMTLLIQCCTCRLLTTTFGAFTQRWNPNVELWYAYGEKLEEKNDAKLFVKFVTQEWKCHSCCADEQRAFMFHCARCFFPIFETSDVYENVNTRPQQQVDDYYETWCCECSEQYSGNFSGA
jgi:hypothetical protein